MTPTSAPVAGTNGFTRSTGSPVLGSTVIVEPRASLLWNPRPAFRNHAVLAQGPRLRPSLGLNSVELASPELSGLSLATWNQ